MSLDTNKNCLPKIKTKWETEICFLNQLKPVLLSKLPYVVLQDTVKRVKTADAADIITIFTTLQLTPAPSAKVRMERNAVPNPPKNLKTHNQPLDFVKVHCEYSKLPELHSVAHSLEFQSPLHLVGDGDYGSTDKTCYAPPLQSLPYAHVMRHIQGSGKCWRDADYDVLAWESTYVPKQIHRNFKALHPRQILLMASQQKELVKRGTLINRDMNSYKYPSRYLSAKGRMANKEKESEKIITKPSKLDLLLSISDIKYRERLALSRIDTAISKEEKQNLRFKEKIAKDYSDRCKDIRVNIAVKLLESNK
jgi:hypothetical protein